MTRDIVAILCLWLAHLSGCCSYHDRPHTVAFTSVAMISWNDGSPYMVNVCTDGTVRYSNFDEKAFKWRDKYVGVCDRTNINTVMEDAAKVVSHRNSYYTSPHIQYSTMIATTGAGDCHPIRVAWDEFIEPGYAITVLARHEQPECARDAVLSWTRLKYDMAMLSGTSTTFHGTVLDIPETLQNVMNHYEVEVREHIRVQQMLYRDNSVEDDDPPDQTLGEGHD